MYNTIEYKGLTMRVEHVADEHTDAPQDVHDGHGPVSDYEHGNRGDKWRDWRLYSDRSTQVYYEFPTAMRQAKREQWGLCPADMASLRLDLGREPRAREVLRRAVEKDFNFLRGWYRGDWWYVGVVVTLLDTEGAPIDHVQESLWGIESDATEYLAEVEQELAEQIASRVGDAPTLLEIRPARFTTYKVREG